MAALPLEVTLYHYPRTRSTRVLWLLHELGDKVNVTCKRVELMKGEAYSPEFMKMNPNHALPVLLYKDASGEDQAVFESCGIVEFLTEALAAGQLAPPIGLSKERADYQKLSTLSLKIHFSPKLDVFLGKSLHATHSQNLFDLLLVGFAAPNFNSNHTGSFQSFHLRKWLWFSGSWMDQLLWQLRQHDSSGILPADQKDSRVVDRTKAKWIKDCPLESLQGIALLNLEASCVSRYCLRSGQQRYDALCIFDHSYTFNISSMQLNKQGFLARAQQCTTFFFCKLGRG